MKNVKKIIAIMLVMSTMFGFVGCGIERFEEVSERDFKNALEDVFGADNDEIVESAGENGDAIFYIPDEGCLIMYGEFDDEDDAYDYFEEVYDDYEDVEEDYDVDVIKKGFDENYGYLVFRTSDEDLMEDFVTYDYDELIHASYYTGCMYISIMCTDNNIDEALELIEVLDLPSI